MATFLEGGLHDIGLKVPDSFKPKNNPIKSLKEIGEIDIDPVQLMNAFKTNKMCEMQKPKKDKEKIYAPDYFIISHCGDCKEVSIFYRGYANLYDLENTICLFKPTIKYEENVGIGHMFPIFRHPIHKTWFIWNYLAPGYGAVNGPFDNKEELLKAAAQCFAVLFNDSSYYPPFKSQTHVTAEVYCTYLLEDDLKKNIDTMIKNNHSVDNFFFLKNIQSNVDFSKYVVKRQKDIYKSEKKPVKPILFDPVTKSPKKFISSKENKNKVSFYNNESIYSQCLDMFKKMGK